MKEESKLYVFITNILRKLGIVKTYAISHITMCENARNSGICNPDMCDGCAWNRDDDEDEDSGY